MKTGKIILLTTVFLAAGIGIAYAFRKPKKTSAKKVNVIADAATTITAEGTDILKKGSSDVQRVMQLQEVLNELHKSAKYINLNCGGIKWGYMQSANMSDGNVVPENGIFDAKTQSAAKFYLNQEEIDLWFLENIRNKIAKYKKGDKCIYPMAIT